MPDRLRVVIVGLGVQGRKRHAVAGPDVVATVDSVVPSADHKRVEDVSLASYDAAFVCVPDGAKPELLSYFLRHRKHVLVEKPLLAEPAVLKGLAKLASDNGTVCYTAYNHRFEPHIRRMKRVIASGRLGKVYLARFFYGNGTARDVRASPWRDAGAGVLSDLGSHLLDLASFLFDCRSHRFTLRSAQRFENRAFDHVAFSAVGEPTLEMEACLISWRNTFTLDVHGEKGSAHIESLCKWGPSSFTLRRRVLPSGRPDEHKVTLVQADPTWQSEYKHFKSLCGRGNRNDADHDLWIAHVIESLEREEKAA